MQLTSRRRAWIGLGIVLMAALGAGVIEQRDENAARAQSALNEEVVYLDAAGIVRVLDPQPPGGLPDGYTVAWSSPVADGAWQAVALGDFNADGDDEIVAVRETAINGFNLAIYDPVVSPSNDVRPEDVAAIDGIPWRTLFKTTLFGAPELVAAGDFDLTTAGAEIFVSSRHVGAETEVVAARNDRRFLLLHRAPGDVAGQDWTVYNQPLDAEVVWQTVDAGNVDLDGADEVVLTGDDGYMHVYRVEGDRLSLLFSNDSESRPWQDAVFGQFFADGFGEIAAVREASSDLPRFYVFSYDPTVDVSFRDRYSEYFAPSPDRVFAANVNGNNDDEAFLLRGPVPAPPSPTPTPPPRANLIMRNFSGDAIPNFEIILSPLDGFDAGAGGDLDGDTRDEIVIARADRIRVYYQPEAGATTSTTFTDYTLATDAKTLQTGNLDRNGIRLFPNFAVTPQELTVQLPSGEQSTQPSVVVVSVENSTEPVEYRITVSGAPDWLSVTPLSGVMPVALQITFDAYGLAPLSNPTAVIQVTALNDAPVLNSPLSIPVTLQVQPGLYPQPARVWHFRSCNDDPEAPVTTRLTIGGLVSVPFSARIEPASATWVDFSAAGTLLPTTLTLTIDPAAAPADAAQQAQLVIDATSNQGAPLSISVPILLLCETTHSWLPLIGNGSE